MALLATYLVPHPPIIIKEIGKEETKHVKKTIESYKQLAEDIHKLQVDTIIFVTPHNTAYHDYFHVSPGPAAQGSFAAFGHEELTFYKDYDQDIREQIIKEATKKSIPIGTLGEKDARLDHGVMVPLSFLKGRHKIVRISISGLEKELHYQLGQAIQKVAEESTKNLVFIASGDLSHTLKKEGPYGYTKEGPVFDRHIKNALTKGDFTAILDVDDRLAEQAKECGLRPLFIMAGVLDQLDISGKLFSYEGPFGVGYAVARYQVIGLNKDNQYLKSYQDALIRKVEKQKAKEDAYVKLARQSLEYYLLHHQYLPITEDIKRELREQQKAVFVTLKKAGKLRGCIGTLEPTKDTLAEEIIYNAVSAGLRDPRFEEVHIEELQQLTYSVDVLSTPEDIDDPAYLDPKHYGVIVYTSGKSGLLLPNLEGINTVEEQLAVVKQKANIHPDETYKMKRFNVVRHH